MIQFREYYSFTRTEFKVICKTTFGENLFICGNIPQLGNWNPFLGARLETNDSIYPQWITYFPINIRSHQLIEFKVCIINGSQVTWQHLPQNRYFYVGQTPASISLQFNSMYLQYLEKRRVELEHRRGMQVVINDMESQWGSSIENLSNYPLQKYHKGIDSHRYFDYSDISSNLISRTSQSEIDLEQIILQQFKYLPIIKPQLNLQNHKKQRKYSLKKYHNKFSKQLETINEDSQFNVNNQIDAKKSFRSLPKYYHQACYKKIEKLKISSIKSFPRITTTNSNLNQKNIFDNSNSSSSNSKKENEQKQTIKGSCFSTEENDERELQENHTEQLFESDNF